MLGTSVLFGLGNYELAEGSGEGNLRTMTDKTETVILLHGMGRTRVSLLVLQGRLKRAGYRTLNFPYQTATRGLDENTEQLRQFIREHVQEGATYHLIGHSLGNIIVRNGFRDGMPEGLGRIVMLAPPNQPPHLAHVFKDFPVYRWITGDSGKKLTEEDFYRQLPVPKGEFGVIAGDRGQSITFNEPNDGILTIESTKLDGMKDFKVVHHTHTFMMNSRDTLGLCVNFLRAGKF
ncbi:hypothetical protein HYR69_03815 [Candidatus Sumerlaeota bacterium]|nr:hypothetical protein [Candidatus Sumerlaeota bacterium]MBI3736990.1 hypothetical protein [Candidatus Sumerlaeota bacterium]